MKRPPFQRTECTCAECVGFCTRPGNLIPSDLPRLRAHLANTGRNPRVEVYLAAGRGALVMDRRTGVQRRIRTIVPRVVDGHCVFLAGGRCTVWEVSPFGCAYFDAHMDRTVGDARSLWGLKQVDTDSRFQALVRRLEERDGESKSDGPVRARVEGNLGDGDVRPGGVALGAAVPVAAGIQDATK